MNILTGDEIATTLGFTEYTCGSTRMLMETAARAIEE